MAASLKSLAVACRALANLLESGVPVVKAFEVAGQRASDRQIRTAFDDVATRLRAGDDVTSALERQGIFPELLTDMVYMSEQTGALPEVLRSLAVHFERNRELRKDLIARLIPPGLQLFAAVHIIGFLIFLLGMIAEGRGGEPVDVLGWGLTGVGGAVAWLGTCYCIAAGVVILYQFITRTFAGRKLLHSALLNVPIIGTCMRDFAIARFAWAFHLTQQAGIAIDESLETSLRATGNGAFAAAAPPIVDRVMLGDQLHEALESSELFPQDFLHIVEVAETSGTVPEALDRLSPQFEDQARRSLAAMAAAIAWAARVLVMGFIIFVIFSIAMWYVNLLQGALDEALQ